MAVPRFAPLIMVDGIVREVTERPDFVDQKTGVASRRGRKVVLQTGRGFIEVVFASDDDRFPLVEEHRLTVFCELSEWVLDNGRGGCTLKFAAPVTAEHLKEIVSSLGSASSVKQD